MGNILLRAVVAAAPAQAEGRGPRPRRLPQARGAVADDADLGPLAVAVAASGCITALTAPVYSAAVVVTVLVGVLALFTSVWVSTTGRGRRGIGLVSLYFSFLVLVVGVAQGGNFDPDTFVKIYKALAEVFGA